MKLKAFGVVLFTLLVQSTTMRPLLRQLGLVTRPVEQVEYEKRYARLTAANAALAHMEHHHADGLMSSLTREQLRPQLIAKIETLANDVREVLKAEPRLEAEEIDTIRREGLRAQRSALLGLQHDGVISDDVFTELAAETDTALTAETLPSDSSEPESLLLAWKLLIRNIYDN